MTKREVTLLACLCIAIAIVLTGLATNAWITRKTALVDKRYSLAKEVDSMRKLAARLPELQAQSKSHSARAKPIGAQKDIRDLYGLATEIGDECHRAGIAISQSALSDTTTDKALELVLDGPVAAELRIIEELDSMPFFSTTSFKLTIDEQSGLGKVALKVEYATHD